MQIVEYQTELFHEEDVPTEETAFRLLKQCPPYTNATYLAVPWAAMLNRRKKKVAVRGVQVQQGVTVCQHIRFREIIPICLNMGVETLFTPHAESQSFTLDSPMIKMLDCVSGLRHLVQDRIAAAERFRILPFPHFAVNGIAPASKDLWFSFVGFNTHASREQLFAMPIPDGCIIKERKKWHFQVDANRRDQEKLEYQSVLARSRFSICPRGTGPGTLRFWESLEAGSIPVLISDGLQLPECFDWSSCIVRVAERDTANISQILQQIPLEREQQMRRQCLQASRAFSGENFVSCIRNHFAAQRSAA
jgi:hypothetical protein